MGETEAHADRASRRRSGRVPPTPGQDNTDQIGAGIRPPHERVADPAHHWRSLDRPTDDPQESRGRDGVCPEAPRFGRGPTVIWRPRCRSPTATHDTRAPGADRTREGAAYDDQHERPPGINAPHGRPWWHIATAGRPEHFGSYIRCRDPLTASIPCQDDVDPCRLRYSSTHSIVHLDRRIRNHSAAGQSGTKPRGNRRHSLTQNGPNRAGLGMDRGSECRTLARPNPAARDATSSNQLPACHKSDQRAMPFLAAELVKQRSPPDAMRAVNCLPSSVRISSDAPSRPSAQAPPTAPDAPRGRGTGEHSCPSSTHTRRRRRRLPPAGNSDSALDLFCCGGCIGGWTGGKATCSIPLHLAFTVSAECSISWFRGRRHGWDLPSPGDHRRLRPSAWSPTRPRLAA